MDSYMVFDCVLIVPHFLMHFSFVIMLRIIVVLKGSLSALLYLFDRWLHVIFKYFYDIELRVESMRDFFQHKFLIAWLQVNIS